MPLQHYHSQNIAQAPGLPAPAKLITPEPDNSLSRLAGQIVDATRQAAGLIGRAYVSQRTGEVNDALMAVEQKFSQWQADYQKQNTGRLGLNAAQDYGQTWKQMAEEAVKEFDAPGYEVFGDMLRQRLNERGAYALRDGLAWSARQGELWKQSQEESQTDQFFRDVAANPHDIGRIMAEREALKGSLAARNPGLDLGARFNALDEKTVDQMAEALLAQGDTAGLRRLFQQPIARRGPKPGSVSERNLAVWNYGNVRNLDGSFAAYASQRDGLMAMAERFRRYHNAPERGWHANTLREVMNIYAPPSENKTNRYAETLGKWMGIDPDQQLDFDDPATLAQFIRHVPRYEHGQFVDIPQEEALDAAKAVLSGQRPQSVGAAPAQGRGMGGALGAPVMEPKKMAAYLARADALDRQQAAGLRQQMQGRIENYIAASRDGHIMDLPCSQEQIMQVFGAEAGQQVWSRVSGAHELAMDMSAALTMTDNGLNELLARRRPDPASPAYASQAALHGELVRGVTALRKQRQDDPALYVCRANPQAAKAREEFLRNLNPDSASRYLAAMQAGLSALELGQDRLLPRADGQLLSAWLMQSDNPARDSKRLAECFGREYPKIMQSISPSLSADVALLGSGMDESAARLIHEALADKDFEKKHFTLFKNDTARNEFEAEARELSSKAAASFLGGRNADIPQAINRQTRLLALQYMRAQGMQQSEAIKKAYEKVVGERYEIVENYLPARASFFGLAKGDPMPPCRIPKALDADVIRTGMARAMQSLPAAELMRQAVPGADPNKIDQAYGKALRDNAYWLTDADESGLVLFLGGNAVRRTDGEPYRLSWKELEDLGLTSVNVRLEEIIQEE